MVGIAMKVGSKGQVVIPQQIREDLGISPGSEVIFDVEQDRAYIERPCTDLPKIFREIAAQAKPGIKIDIIHSAEREIEERWQRSRRST